MSLLIVSDIFVEIGSQYTVLVDRQARNRHATPSFSSEELFGQLQTIFVVPLPESEVLGLRQSTTLLLASIQHADANLETPLKIPYYNKLGRTDVVDIQSIQCVVGRVRDSSGNRYAILDRSGAAARLEFNSE